MTPEQKLKHMILIRDAEFRRAPAPEGVTAATVDEMFEMECGHDGELQDAINEVRCSGEETGLNLGHYSRHYECDEVAAKAPDGSWVGWTYWYGGGKHGEPSAVEWIEHAYDVSCVEEEKMVVVRTFAKTE